MTDDNFATIVAAVEEGRVVYANLQKALLLLLSTSVAEVVVLSGALMLGLPPPFAAVQILWNNLITEGLTTVKFDQIQHYRPRVNVVERPTRAAGARGYSLTGHHEILVPLYCGAVLAELA